MNYTDSEYQQAMEEMIISKGDYVTVALGGRRYPNTHIESVQETPDGTSYGVDIFGFKLITAEQIVSVNPQRWK